MVEELRESVVKNLLFVTSFLKLVRIEKNIVPELVEVTSSNVILECQFTVVDDNFTLQWMFNNGTTPVYEWSPYSEPKIGGILEGRLDLTYRVPRNLSEGRRALRITNLTTELSGEYTCIVSNRGSEARKTKDMLIYRHTVTKVWQDEAIKSVKEAHRQGLSTGLRNPSGKGKQLIVVHIGVERDFQLKSNWHHNSGVLDISCIARGVYPRPDLTIEYNNSLVSGQLQRVWGNDGLFDVFGFAQAMINSESHKAVVACRLYLPQADYTAIIKKIQFNGGNCYCSTSWTLALMCVCISVYYINYTFHE